jgi:hypothetical protein
MVARALVAIFLATSFFASLGPLGAAASAGHEAMACCAGQAGHCNSGLVVELPKVERPQPPAPEPMCGLRQPEKDRERALPEPTGDATGEAITIVATASAAGMVQESSDNQDSARTASTAHHSPALHHSLAKPCPIDCCASTAAGVRKPRPRETSLLVHAGHSPSPITRSFRATPTPIFATGASLQRTLPRGPPSFSC